MLRSLTTLLMPSLHRRIESKKVPACSRMTANWPVFSEYLNWVWGIPSFSSAATSMGWSRRAGSQKLGAQKMTPSASLSRTVSTNWLPLASPGSYREAASVLFTRKALDRAVSGSPLASTSPRNQRSPRKRSSPTIQQPARSRVSNRPTGGCSQNEPTMTTREWSFSLRSSSCGASSRYSRIRAVCSSGGRTQPARSTRYSSAIG